MPISDDSFESLSISNCVIFTSPLFCQSFLFSTQAISAILTLFSRKKRFEVISSIQPSPYFLDKLSISLFKFIFSFLVEAIQPSLLNYQFGCNVFIFTIYKSYKYSKLLKRFVVFPLPYSLNKLYFLQTFLFLILNSIFPLLYSVNSCLHEKNLLLFLPYFSTDFVYFYIFYAL